MCNVFRAASIWIKIALISFAVGLLLFIIGFATVSWIIWPYDKYHQARGLWQWYACFQSSGCVTQSYVNLNDYHRAIQAMECLGLIGYALALLFLFLYVFVNSCRRRDILQAVTAIAFAGVLFACIGFAIFGSTSNPENRQGSNGTIGWSMGIAIAGTVFYALGGIMLIVQQIR